MSCEFFRQTVNLFRLRKGEGRVALVVLLVSGVLNAINVMVYFNELTTIEGNSWRKFIHGWHISGFDPITYSVLTDWSSGYNIYRHPLLAYFVWPFTMLNKGLTALLGFNCATVITACLLVFFATYTFIFLSRIFWEIIGTKKVEAYVLTSLTFSFAFIMLSMIAPDHFGPSMFCLVLTLYLSGRKLQRGKALNWWQTIVMFFFTAGISLNNGLKVFLAALFTRRKKFFKPGYLVVAVLLPSLLMWYGARYSYRYFVWPKEIARKEKNKEVEHKRLERMQKQAVATFDSKDTALIAHVRDSVKKSMEEKKQKRWTKSAVYKHTGKPLMKGEFMRWTDVTTNRLDVGVESLFGEGIMLHEDYLLGDVLVNRPVIVHYKNWLNYVVEAALLLLFAFGIWYGRRSLFMWTAMSFFMMDMALHMGLGFGINEVFIMSAHYLYVLPICIGFLLVGLRDRWRRKMTVGLGVVAAYIAIWNVVLLLEYFYL